MLLVSYSWLKGYESASPVGIGEGLFFGFCFLQLWFACFFYGRFILHSEFAFLCIPFFRIFVHVVLKIPSASLEGIKNLEKPRKTLHKPRKNREKSETKTCRNSVFVSSFNVFFACVASFLQFVLHLFCMFFAFFFANFLVFFVFFQLSQRSCLEMANLQKQNAKKHANKLKKHAKKLRFHDSAEHAANPMQQNADEKRKSTPNIKYLKKKQIGHAKLFQKNVKTHSLSTSQSLYQTNSHN